MRAHIGDEYGSRYLPSKANFYSSKASAQEAHEAIRPTDLGGIAGLAGAEADARRLYDLIWRQFVASQMTRAEYLATPSPWTTASSSCAYAGRILQFDGYTPRIAEPQQRRYAVAGLCSRANR